MLAAIPSVVLGLWGILILGPFVQNTLEPFLGSTLGFLPFFQGRHSTSGILTAVLILTIMVVPIVASVSRELFATVPAELREGALALGATRWEMVRGVLLPAARPGILAAVALGFGRAVGEAIAVTQVIGSQPGIRWSLFSHRRPVSERFDQPADLLARLSRGDPARDFAGREHRRAAVDQTDRPAPASPPDRA